MDKLTDEQIAEGLRLCSRSLPVQYEMRRMAELLPAVLKELEGLRAESERLREVAIELAEGLSWALDLLDMYDERLASIDGADRVYSPLHLAGKSKARAALSLLKQAGKPEAPTR